MQARLSPRRIPIPISEQEVSTQRLRVFAVVVALLLALLLSRLWYLQVYRGEVYREQANNNRLRSIREVAPRGVIEDRSGQVLVTNSAQFTVFILPTDLPKKEPEKAVIFARLAKILEISPSELTAIMKRNNPGGSNPIPVAEGVSAHTLARIAEERLSLPGVITDVEPVRVYPGGKLASHLLGYIGQISDKEMANEKNQKEDYKSGDFIGKTGIEKQYDALLNGKAGGQMYEVDARGRRRRKMGNEPVIAGATLRLNVEAAVQKACEQAFAGRKGAAVAIDPRDGRVLAMGSFPDYDPTLFARRPLLSKQYASLRDEGAFFNRATMSPQPPGSTFKVITAAAGLVRGDITEHTWDSCPGYIMLGKTRKRCHSSHGGVNLSRALEASCDVYFYHAGLRMGPDALADWSRKFGLGEKTGIDMPWEMGGTVPSPAWKRKMAPVYKNPDTTWYPGETANVAIGQGGLQTTPLQMAMVTGAIANGGTIYEPHIVSQAVSSQDKSVLYTMKPKATRRLPLTPQQLRLITVGMRQVIVGSRGTSHAANLAGVAVAGKSGSAELYTNGPTHAWFICYAPFDKPTIAICVFLDANGKRLHGGAEAAPIARKMLAAHFGLPDRLASASGGSASD